MDDPIRYDSVITACRDALLRFGSRTGAFDRTICRCSDPHCVYRAPTTFPLHLLLQEVGRFLRTDSAAEIGELDLRGPLTELGDAFGLFSCGCRDPECPTVAARSAPVAELAYVVFLQWYALAGVIGRENEEDALNGAEMGLRNLHLVSAWCRRIVQVGLSRVRSAVAAYAATEQSPWGREAMILASECVAHWIPDPPAQPEVYLAINHALAVAELDGFDGRETASWWLLWNNTMVALLSRDLVAPDVTAAMYAPMETLVPLAALRLDVIAGDTGAPPGFFRI